MKFLKVFLALILFITFTLYILLFTSIGNSLLKPVIEGKIKSATLLHVKLQKFQLRWSSLDIDLLLTPNNLVHLNGDFSLLSQDFDLHYKGDIKALQELHQLTKTDLRGTLFTHGTVKGNLEKFLINGLANIAKGDINYQLDITNFNPSSIQAQANNLQIASLLNTIAQKPYANGIVNLTVDFKNIQPHNLDGKIQLNTKKGTFNTKVLKDDFNITIPKTTFNMGLVATLEKDDIDYKMAFNSNLAKLQTQGKVTPQPLELDIYYNAMIKELALFKPLTNQDLRGPLALKGTLKGDARKADLLLVSDIAKSDTKLSAELKNFTPIKLIAKIKHLQLDSLLYTLGKEPYAQATINCDANLNNLKPKQLNGEIKLWSQNGKFNTKVLKEAFHIKVPHTTFKLNLAALLKKDHILYTTLFDSNLAKIDSKGTVTPEPLKLDLTYKANIKELALLKPVTNADLRGKLNLHGNIKGDKKELHILTKSDIASSKTTIKTTLKEFKPDSIQASIKALQLSKLLYMLKQPSYTEGTLDLVADITSLKQDHLKGDITLQSSGDLNNVYLTKAYNFKHPMPKTHFTLDVKTLLEQTEAISDIQLNSTLAKLLMPKTVYSIKEGTLHSNYTLDIPSLKALYFATDKKFKGDFKAQGKIQKDKDLLLTANSKLADGEMKVHLLNDDLNLDISKMKTKKLLYILNYPQIIDGAIDSKVVYNLLKQQGDIKATLSNGLFAKNMAFDLLKEYDKVDLYREKFNGNLNAKIKQELIDANFELLARKASISSSKTIIDTKKETIDSKIFIKTKNSPIHLTLKGDIDQPKVGVDLNKFLETKAGKKLEEKANKEINRFLKKLF
ncbi:MAG: hypothetical protein GXO11_04990 [Epsilonproteobacteria bacterium]|nr:hypothetical protein [Campylobacterota bacterium]